MQKIHLVSCDEHSAEVLRDAAVELGLPLKRTRKAPRPEGGVREIVIVDGDQVEAKQVFQTSRPGVVCIGLVGERSAAYELLDAGAHMVLHKPVFSEWAKVCLKQACYGR